MKLVSQYFQQNQKADVERLTTLLGTLRGHEEYLLDESGVIISSNLEIAKITGYEEYEIIGKHLSIFYEESDKPQAKSHLSEALAQQKLILTGIRKKKSGATFWAKVKIRLTHDNASRKLFRMTLQDATHKEISNIRLQALRSEFLTVFDNPFVGAFKFRRSDYKIQICNRKVLDITGKKELAFFNEVFTSQIQWGDFLSILDRDELVDGFQFVTHGSNKYQENWALLSARKNKKSAYVWGVMMDISEQYDQVAKLKNLNEELENFTYHASHDFRAPLTTIQGLVALGLRQDSDIKTSHKYFELIKDRINHLDILLKDLTSISYNKEIKVSQSRFLFREEIDSILKDYPTEKSSVRLEINDLNEFHSDSVRLKTILRNLIQNSFKYSTLEDRKANIRLKINVYPNYASVLLQDNGIGIDQQFKGKIFDMFFRATASSTGTGLGLYIVKSMLEKLHGRISVESTVNNGTTFLLTIPNSYKINDFATN